MTTLLEAFESATSVAGLQPLPKPAVVQRETLPAWFDVSEFAADAVSLACAAVARLHERQSGRDEQVEINQRLVNLWFGMTLQPIDFELQNPWDDIAGDYQARDGWVRLHTNAPHHKAAALEVLSTPSVKDDVRRAVKKWNKHKLETAVVAAGGCAAAMNTSAEWQQHPMGRLANTEPLVHWNVQSASKPLEPNGSKQKPLSGIKVLDLTRILAGPVATRFLAAFGADVVRVDPPGWDETGIIPEVTLGKDCVTLNLKTEEDLASLKRLIKTADVIVHGYRADALCKLGLSEEDIRDLNPNIINVCLNAYGWTGPWKNRRGFDSLVQMNSGIAQYGMEMSGCSKPVPLPVQALDHATGYVMAAATIRAIELRYERQGVSTIRCSLAATAAQLLKTKRSELSSGMSGIAGSDFPKKTEATSWGTARRVRVPFEISGVRPSWKNGSCRLHSTTIDSVLQRWK